MDQRALYERILGLTSPWYVTEVDLDEADLEVQVHVECDRSAVLNCPKCGRPSPRYDSRRRQWRHLDTCQFQTLIVADVPRVSCSEHGCLTIQVPWAEGNSRYTALFEGHVIRWLRDASIYAVSKQLKLSWTAIDRIMERAVARGMGLSQARDTTRLAVDETSFKKGHDYVTIVSNHLGQVLAVEDGKSAESLSSYFRQLSPEHLSAIQSVSMDMSMAFQNATFEHVPDAHHKIAFDHFHVAQALNEALNSTRKSELTSVDAALRQQVHRTRFNWMRNRVTLAQDQRDQLNALTKHLANTALVWYFKERARDIWKGNRVRGARAAWQEWISLAKASKISPLVSVAKQVESKLWGILNAMRLQASNALAEAINGKIRMMRVKAKGYRNKERFKRAIMFHYGGLALEPNPLQ